MKAQDEAEEGAIEAGSKSVQSKPEKQLYLGSPDSLVGQKSSPSFREVHRVEIVRLLLQVSRMMMRRCLANTIHMIMGNMHVHTIT